MHIYLLTISDTMFLFQMNNRNNNRARSHTDPAARSPPPPYEEILPTIVTRRTRSSAGVRSVCLWEYLQELACFITV